eukprot:TRINITY_DN2295_c0_g2_i4.p1 TRINITY_DN2295_c0_g2~~TRINITY_DN2295_c0_g2_i4.p1  ORF type:complete len:298 (+),score=42.73 TRINITY_DN2295_c0_g2_i4:165-1058(+)
MHASCLGITWPSDFGRGSPPRLCAQWMDSSRYAPYGGGGSGKAGGKAGKGGNTPQPQSAPQHGYPQHQPQPGYAPHHPQGEKGPPMIAPTPVPQGHYVQPGYTPQPQPAPQHWNLNPQHQPQPGHAPHPTKGKGEKSGKGEKGDRPARPAGRRGKRGGVARAAHYFEDAQRRADEGERQAYANVIAVLADRHHPGPRAALDRLLDARHAADRAREAASAAYRRHIQEQKARAAQKMHVTENAWELADAGHEEEQDEAVEAAAADDEEEKEEAEEAVPGLPHLTPDAFSTPSSLTPMF